jgi:benzoyl-CoA reductase/2-hydroxyglutaryl-CoA dehydratase subunit BcrC/BadD/HgdB
MYEYMAEFKAVHVMQLPNSASDAASRALWKTEILRLQQVIEIGLARRLARRRCAKPSC